MIRERKKKQISLIILLLCSIAKSNAQIGTDRVETIAGELSIINRSEKKTEVRLRNKVVLTVNKKASLSMNDLNEISIYDVVRHPIHPFDEVVILNNDFQSFHCGPGVFFLGLKKNGTYQFSRSTPNCMDREIAIKKDRIEVTAEPDAHSTEYHYMPIPGGKWVYRNGLLHTIRYIVLPDPRARRKTPNNKRIHASPRSKLPMIH